MESLTDYDVIVVGAGTGGTVTSAALANKGYKVALMDRQPKEKIGIKVCGDATSTDHFRRIKEVVNIEPPHGDEIRQYVKGAWIFSPDHEVKYELTEENTTGVLIDRFKLGMRMLDDAMNYGAELFENSMVKEPIIQKDQVIGMKYRGGDKNLHEMTAKVVVDASGIAAVLRTKLDPEKTFMDINLMDKDVCNCYREVRDLETEIESPEFIRIMFDQDLCPGGYLWEFPRGPNSMNAGLGVMRINQLNPHQQFNLYLKRKETFYKNSKLIHGGAWRVPLRRPQDNLVWNGFALVGDAGTQVKPTDGGGIGISIQAGAMAAKAITNALENDDVSTKSLWPYNIEFMAKIASVNAPLALMKDFVIPLPSSIVNYIFHKHIVEGDELLYGNASGQVSGGILKLLQRAWRGRRILGTLLKFRTILNKMNKARDLYNNFPESPDDFLSWRATIKELYGEK